MAAASEESTAFLILIPVCFSLCHLCSLPPQTALLHLVSSQKPRQSPVTPRQPALPPPPPRTPSPAALIPPPRSWLQGGSPTSSGPGPHSQHPHVQQMEKELKPLGQQPNLGSRCSDGNDTVATAASGNQNANDRLHGVLPWAASASQDRPGEPQDAQH